MDDLERVELSAILDFFAAAPPDVAQVLDLDVFEMDGPAAFSMGAHPKMHLFNRVLGLGDAVLVPDLEAWFGSRRCSFAISVRPGAKLERELGARGYRQARAFMKFRRSMAAPPEPETPLRIERIDKERADEYGAVVATVFGMASPLDRWFAGLGTRPGWACFGAFDGDRLVGTGAAHVAGRLAWLGAAGTLPEARGRGAQLAILAARIRAAADAGARVLAVETVDRVDGQAGALLPQCRPRRVRGGVCPGVVASTRVGDRRRGRILSGGEYRLMIYPLVLGTGKRFFRDGGDKTTLTLKHAETATSGVTMLVCEPAA